jgi:RES domain-containing protein
MILYRFANKQFSDDLTGTGAKLYGGRWNHKGLAALYTSSSISLSLLEILVNALSLEHLQSLSLMKIEVPAGLETSVRTLKQLKAQWFDDVEYSRFIGSEFLQNRNFLMLQCPSSVVMEEYNFVLNPLHADYHKVKLVSAVEYQFDKRLFKATV